MEPLVLRLHLSQNEREVLLRMTDFGRCGEQPRTGRVKLYIPTHRKSAMDGAPDRFGPAEIQEQATTKANAGSSTAQHDQTEAGNSNHNSNDNSTSWLGECIHSHLSDDKAVATMGHPFCCAGLENYNYNCKCDCECRG